MTTPGFFVTGATGFLGSHIARGLLARGYRVTALARDRQGQSAEDRVRRALSWCGFEGPAAQVCVVRGDVAKDRFGLDPSDWQALAAQAFEVVHCAARTGFSRAQAQELESVNVGGTLQALALAREGGSARFHLISTAFVAGKSQGTATEAWQDPPAFNNPYEETKYRAEAKARQAAAQGGFDLCVYRPSIVYGDSLSGRCPLFNALYYPVKMTSLLRNLCLEASRRPGGRAMFDGAEIRSGGGLRIPLRVATVPDAALNMVPVDHFTRCFIELVEKNQGSGTFHIVTGENISVETVVGYTARYYGIEGLKAAPLEAFQNPPPSPLEKFFDSVVAAYRPYMNDPRVFDDSRAGAFLKPAGLECPTFTYPLFKRLIDYAESVDWGKSIPA